MLPTRVSLLIESHAVASAAPAARKWLLDLLQRGERASNAVEASPARRTKARQRELAKVDAELDAAGI
jgi:hypothetical protein